ncbi:hypothetical protein ABT390_35445 [Streptomyces aurantiacus]|uniref:Uncharacterized protein n=1 Tax=Streptomyces aurantiacus JA 4570 TaxID=1286094 RepID=S3ZRB7_9ACTN|nr:hypothetical protein [Streptomyces aurantiacus]EPH40945.1 hypothetical protein STRAU_5987 [Streptomyces aurantiacus JA 4570]
MTAAENSTDEELIGRCYTKARRAPLMHGVIRGVGEGRNLRLPGGPYTITQLAAIVGSISLLMLTRPLWGGNGLADLLVLLVVPAAAAITLRFLHIDGRNPAAAAVSVVRMLCGPKWGRLRGQPLRIPTPLGLAPLASVCLPTAAPAATPRPEPAPAGANPAPPAADPPAPAAAAPSLATGVQALLARREQALNQHPRES